MRNSSVPGATTAPPIRRAVQLGFWLVLGTVLGAGAVALGIPSAALIGCLIGAIAAVVTQRIQLAWFAARVRHSQGSDWIDRIPTSLAALRKPLRAVESQINDRSEALDAATARDRLRDVAVDALELEVDTLDRALVDSRADMAAVLDVLDRALACGSPETVLRRELVELRELVRLSIYAELPSQTVPLGDVVAAVVEAGVPRGRIRVAGSLPSVNAPSPLMEALMRALLGHALAVGEHVVEIAGIIDGGMVAIEVVAPSRPEATIHIAMARRATAILGGDIREKPDRLMVVFPVRFIRGLKAVSPQPIDWDLPEAG
jgi:hypothetical protein